MRIWVERGFMMKQLHNHDMYMQYFGSFTLGTDHWPQETGSHHRQYLVEFQACIHYCPSLAINGVTPFLTPQRISLAHTSPT